MANELKWTVEEIRRNIKNSNPWLCAAILKIYDNQTDNERNGVVTKERNGIGFNAVDAIFFGKIAKLLIDKKFVSKHTFKECQKRMMKYAGQLSQA